jgi:hypothetical protein
MTITYPNGTVRNAIVVSHEEHELRAVVAGCDDVLVFTRIRGNWIAEDLEPVTFEFEWERRVAPPSTSEDDCICPKELADRLTSALCDGGPEELYAFTPEGTRVPIGRKHLLPN